MWLCSCEGFSGTAGEEEDSEETTEEIILDTTEDTAEETEPPIGHTIENPTPFGEYVQIPASKADQMCIRDRVICISSSSVWASSV